RPERATGEPRQRRHGERTAAGSGQDVHARAAGLPSQGRRRLPHVRGRNGRRGSGSGPAPGHGAREIPDGEENGQPPGRRTHHDREIARKRRRRGATSGGSTSRSRSSLRRSSLVSTSYAPRIRQASMRSRSAIAIVSISTVSVPHAIPSNNGANTRVNPIK